MLVLENLENHVEFHIPVPVPVRGTSHHNSQAEMILNVLMSQLYQLTLSVTRRLLS